MAKTPRRSRRDRPPADRPGVVVAHPGRHHVYETVRGAQEAGVLQAFATGVYLGSGSLSAAAEALARTRRAPRAVRALRDRRDRSIDPRKVVAFPLHDIAETALRPVFPRGRAYLWSFRAGDARIARWLRDVRPAPAVVHGFEYGALETLRRARERGATTILDVVGSHEYNRRVTREEGGKIPSEEVNVRIRREREAADWLLAPSDFVASCLRENGVPEEKIVLLPFGVDLERFGGAVERDEDGLFRVLFVGQIGYRKGLRYLLEAWKRLGLERAELVLVGRPDDFGRRLLDEYRGHYRWIPQVPWHEVTAWFGASDVFAFPSLSEGSAYVTYEALASGLPLVTTPNSGSVARDGREGFIVPPRDVDALADRIHRLYSDEELRRRLGASGRSRIEEGYTWAHYRARLGAIYEALLAGRTPPTRAEDESTAPVGA